MNVCLMNCHFCLFLLICRYPPYLSPPISLHIRTRPVHGHVWVFNLMPGGGGGRGGGIFVIIPCNPHVVKNPQIASIKCAVYNACARAYTRLVNPCYRAKYAPNRPTADMRWKGEHRSRDLSGFIALTLIFIIYNKFKFVHLYTPPPSFLRKKGRLAPPHLL